MWRSGIDREKKERMDWETVPIVDDSKNLGELRKYHIDYGAF